MGSVVVGVIGTLLGVLIGSAAQQVQAMRNRRWQQEDSLDNAKRSVYAEYLRSISASYAEAMAGHRSRSEDGNLYASTAEIAVLARPKVSGPARELADAVIKVHTRIAEGAGVPEVEVADVDRRRRGLIELFQDDLGITPSR